METNNDLDQSLQEQIDKLAHELDKERNTISQLRTSIDVLHAGWSLDKEKLTEAVDKLNEKEGNVIKTEDLEEMNTPQNDNNSKKRMTTRLSSKKRHKGDGNSTNNTSLSESLNIPISCPLCCNQSFFSREALKNHLLGFYDNVVCPICSQNCENVTHLINHLDVECGNKQTNTAMEHLDKENSFTLTKNNLAVVSFKMSGDGIDESSFDGLIITGESKEVNSLPGQMNASNQLLDRCKEKRHGKLNSPKKQNVDSDDEIVLDQETESDSSDVDSEMDNDDASVNESDSEAENEEYFCSGCNLSFTSIIDHIKEHHFGEEVKIEGAPEELKKKLLTCGKVVNDCKDIDCTLQQTENGCGKDLPETDDKHNEEENSHIDNTTGYWTKRGSYYNYVKNEKKFRLLHPTFVPSECKLKTSVDNSNKQLRPKMPFNKLDLIQLVDDESLLGGAVPAFIGIYIVDENKAKDRFKLGPTAKFIPILHRSRMKMENIDEMEEFNFKSNNAKFMELQRVRSSQYIHVLRVLLGKDREITIENVNFDVLPSVPENMVPYLENVANPVIPLLKGAKQLKWKCSVCLSPISSIFFLSKAHVCYKCKYCGKGFRKNIGCFMKHLLECGKSKANTEKPYACSSCPSFFNTVEDAREHMSLHFPGSRAVQCSICYCLLNDKTVLNRHLKSEHNTNISQVGNEVKQPRLKAKTKYRIENPPPCATPTQISKRKRGRNPKHLNNTEVFSEVQIKEEDEDADYFMPRSSRRKRVNKTYFDECFLYYE